MVVGFLNIPMDLGSEITLLTLSTRKEGGHGLRVGSPWGLHIFPTVKSSLVIIGGTGTRRCLFEGFWERVLTKISRVGFFMKKEQWVCVPKRIHGI